MAIQASPLDRVVLELDFRDGVADRLVAPNAEFIPGLQQVALIVGGMWIVTLHAIPFDSDLMGADGFVGNNSFMALEAHPSCRRIQKLSVGRGMRVVAPGTLGTLHRGVYELAFELFLEIGMAVETQLPVGPRLELELILAIRN